MNILTSTIFAVIMVVGWIMVIWYIVIIMLGKDIRKDIRMLGGEQPPLKPAGIIWACVFNLITVVLTVGYFIDGIASLYKENPMMLLSVSFLAVIMATLLDDRLHHVLINHIAVFETLKAEKEKQKVDNHKED